MLSQRIGLDRTTVVLWVDLLEHRTLVRRGPHLTDRCKHSVALTEAGAELLSQTLADVREAEREVANVPSEQEQEQLKGLLEAAS